MKYGFKKIWVSSASAAVLAMLAAPGIGQAQEQDAAPPAREEPRPDVVVVTGSNIAGASDSGAIAVSIISQDQIEALGESSVGEIMAAIPQAGAFQINDSADGPNDARGDVATVNLRGLGTGNTLVLLNGRRITAHGINQDVGRVPRQITNVNAFPLAAINRVEILRDGASALYGADATAGVVNTILSASFDGRRLTYRQSWLEGTESGESTFDFAAGSTFNEGRTNVLLVGTYNDRDGLFAGELGAQFSTTDKRGLLGDSLFATQNTRFRLTSAISPFGQFRAGSVNAQGVWQGVRVRQGGTNMTSSSGVFSIQPCGYAGTRHQIGDVAGEGCMGIRDNTIRGELWYDFNRMQPNNALGEGVDIQVDADQARGRQLISDLVRYNGYVLAEHQFDNGMEAFGEFLYYRSETSSSRAPQPMDSGLAFLVVPRTNYWNPFGPAGSDNRIAGINAPAEGLDVLIQRWRPTELGNRFIQTESSTYRALGGLRGAQNGWDWETAFGYSRNWTEDTEGNRISKTLLAAELARDTPDAINPFGGPNANTPEQWDRVRISTTNLGETSLATLDFRISRPDAFDAWAGPIGASLSADWRRETYEEDRDDRLDGTITFDTSTVSGISDVVGVSPTADSSASRNVFAAAGEVLVPLVAGSSSGPMFNEVNLQLAVRGEYFDDIDTGTLKPKIALSWFPWEFLNVRAAYSQGFRAPNLVQLYRGDISRLTLGNFDFYRADVVGDAVSTGNAYMAQVRRANPDLENEDTETYVAGINADLSDLFASRWLQSFRVGLDYWRFEQTGVIDTFGAQEALAVDLLLRRQGSSNPNVVRGAPTPEDVAAFDAWNLANPGDQRAPAGEVLQVIDTYINLDRQEADGIDFAMAVTIDAGAVGTFDFDLEATRLLTLNVFRNEELTELVNTPDFTGRFASLAVDRLELDGNPLWRGTASVRWRGEGALRRVGAGVVVRYVDGYDDTGAWFDTPEGERVFWRVKSNLRVSTYVDYRPQLANLPLTNTRVRVGVNNLFDEAPPLYRNARGWDTSYHSVKGREFYAQVRTSF
jgi:iron complex outermembrane recepter protein